MPGRGHAVDAARAGAVLDRQRESRRATPVHSEYDRDLLVRRERATAEAASEGVYRLFHDLGYALGAPCAGRVTRGASALEQRTGHVGARLVRRHRVVGERSFRTSSANCRARNSRSPSSNVSNISEHRAVVVDPTDANDRANASSVLPSAYPSSVCVSGRTRSPAAAVQSIASGPGMAPSHEKGRLPFLGKRPDFERLRGQDLNLRPSGYEPDELPDCSTPRLKRHHYSALCVTL